MMVIAMPVMTENTLAGFCVWQSDSNRYSGPASASCLTRWSDPVDALLYPFNPQAGIELHHNGKSTGLARHQMGGTALKCPMLLPVMFRLLIRSAQP